MNDDTDIPRIAVLFSDPGRARILRALMDGTRRPAGELACAAGISAQSASGHLAKLVRGGLLAAEAQGRHRYYRIASPDVADTVERLATLSVALGPRPPRPPLPSRFTPVQFLYSRTCYDHLAGEMAVVVLDGMLKARWVTPAGRDFKLTRLGERRLVALEVDVAAARASRRVFARACVDLTQRRPHLGGALGAALLDLYTARGWVLRARRSRVVTITPKGQEAFRQVFGLSRP